VQGALRDACEAIHDVSLNEPATRDCASALMP
jgi:hypothetical protein